MKLARIAVVALLTVSACQSSSSGAFERGRDAARTGAWDAAAQYYQRALTEEPENVEYRIAHQRALLEASRVYATVGEMCDALREVWGEYEESPIF